MLTIHTDGSCLNNPGPGGWAFLLVRGGIIVRACAGASAHTTNNQMELRSVLEALRSCDEREILLFSDSSYVVRSINEWLTGWQKTNFKGKKNVELWREYLALAAGRKITAQWVKGHAGDAANELCDLLARSLASGQNCENLCAQLANKPLDEALKFAKNPPAKGAIPPGGERAVTGKKTSAGEKAPGGEQNCTQPPGGEKAVTGKKSSAQNQQNPQQNEQPTPAKYVTLERALGYKFADYSMLARAFRHKSTGKFNNERLEFLGDAVMDLSLAQLLFDDPSRYSEGDLSKLRAALVNESSFARIAQALGLGALLELSAAEDRSGGREKPSLLSDAFEAMMGVIYLEAGFARAHEIACRLIRQTYEHIDTALIKDFKTRLQEFTQERFGELPEYRVLAASGPDHAKVFEVGVFLRGKCLATASARSKKAAEQAAAQRLFKAVNDE